MDGKCYEASNETASHITDDGFPITPETSSMRNQGYWRKGCHSHMDVRWPRRCIGILGEIRNRSTRNASRLATDAGGDRHILDVELPVCSVHPIVDLSAPESPQDDPDSLTSELKWRLSAEYEVAFAGSNETRSHLVVDFIRASNGHRDSTPEAFSEEDVTGSWSSTVLAEGSVERPLTSHDEGDALTVTARISGGSIESALRELPSLRM